MAQLQEVFLFLPTQVSGCQLWLDAADPSANGTTPANGTSVSTWSDKSGNGRNATQATSARQPTFSNNSINFVRANTNYLSLPDASIWSSNAPLSIFTVLTPTSAYSANVFLFQGNAGINSAIGLYTTGTTFSDYWQGFAATAWGSMAVGTRTFISYIYTQSVNIFAYANGTGGLLRNQSAYTVNTTNATIGAEVARSLYSDSSINEILIYNATLSTTQREQIEGYLAWKWNLQDKLPPSHPYKKYRPLAQRPFPTTISPMPLINQNVSVFTPTQLSGCQLWVDAADPASMTFSSGSNLQRWANKATSAGIFTQAGTADRLTYTSSNGYPLVSFNSDGSTSNAWMTTSLSLTANTSFLQVITPITYTSGTWSFYWSWQWTSAGNRLPGLRSSNVNNDLQPYITWVGNNNNRIPITNGTSYLSFVEFTGGGANTRYSINGNTPSAGTIAASNVNSSVFILGGDGNAGATVWGKYYLSEMIMYSNVLTTSQREQIEGYLAWKWGLTTSLPNGHPYKRPPIAPFSFRSVPFNGSLNQWVPTQISGLTLWLDGADRSRLTLTGSAVTQWRDKSGQNNTYTNNGTITYSNQGLSFPGTAYMQNTSLTGFPFGSNPSISTFIVFAYTNANSTRGLFQYGNVTCSKTGYVVYVDNDVTLGNLVLGTLYCGDLNVNGRVTANTITMVSDIVTSTAVSGSLLRAGFINGSPMDNRPINSATGVNFTSSGSSRLGDAAGGYLLGTIYEVLFFNTSVSTAQRQQLEGYLAWKWSLQGNLPATHPYKKFPPAP